MNIRHTLLAALAKDSATIPDLEIATGMDRKKLHDNLKSCVEDGLATRSKDDVTGLPLYSISKAGKTRLADGPQRGLKKLTQPRCDTPAGGGNITPAAVDRSTSLATSSGEAMAVVEAAKQDDAPAEPASDVIPPPDYDPRAVSFSLREQRDALREDIESLRGGYEYALCAIRKALGIDHDPDVGIVPEINRLLESNTDWRAAADAQRDEIDRLRAENAQLAAVVTPLPCGLIGYAIIPDDDELTIYATETAARQKAEDLMVFESDKYPSAFLVAIHARAEMKITWGDV